MQTSIAEEREAAESQSFRAARFWTKGDYDERFI
jgi:hypothetical protein